MRPGSKSQKQQSIHRGGRVADASESSSGRLSHHRHQSDAVFNLQYVWYPTVLRSCVKSGASLPPCSDDWKIVSANYVPRLL